MAQSPLSRPRQRARTLLASQNPVTPHRGRGRGRGLALQLGSSISALGAHQAAPSGTLTSRCLHRGRIHSRPGSDSGNGVSRRQFLGQQLLA